MRPPGATSQVPPSTEFWIYVIKCDYIINKPRRPTNPPKQAHCSLRTRRGAAESGSKAAVGLLRWIGGSRGLLIINITSRVRGKVSISIYGILCKGGLRDLK